MIHDRRVFPNSKNKDQVRIGLLKFSKKINTGQNEEASSAGSQKPEKETISKIKIKIGVPQDGKHNDRHSEKPTAETENKLSSTQSTDSASELITDEQLALTVMHADPEKVMRGLKKLAEKAETNSLWRKHHSLTYDT